MVYIEPHILLGAIVEVKRSDGSWEEAVISNVYQDQPVLCPEVTDNDYFTVTFSEGRTKRILMQQEIELHRQLQHEICNVGARHGKAATAQAT